MVAQLACWQVAVTDATTVSYLGGHLVGLWVASMDGCWDVHLVVYWVVWMDNATVWTWGGQQADEKDGPQAGS